MESKKGYFHQEFQVPKMEGFLNLIRLFLGWGFPYISRIHTAYIGVSYLHFRYLKCLVIFGPNREVRKTHHRLKSAKILRGYDM